MAANEFIATVPEGARHWEDDGTATWTIGHDVYALAKSAEPIGVRDQINAQTQRLNSLLAVTRANEEFLRQDSEVQRDVLWLCESLTEEIAALTEIEGLPGKKNRGRTSPPREAPPPVLDEFGSPPPSIDIAYARSASNLTREMLGQVYSLVSLAKTRAETGGNSDPCLVTTLDHVMDLVGDQAAQNQLETALGMTNAGNWAPLREGGKA